jgi:nitroreductase
MKRDREGPALDPAVVDAAITSWRSIRAFLPEPVPRATLEEILRVAARAPSGTNAQPWKVHVLTGAALQRLSAAILAVVHDPAQLALHKDEYDYYPRRWVEPYLACRRKVGWDLYGLLGIGRADSTPVRRRRSSSSTRSSARSWVSAPTMPSSAAWRWAGRT